MKSTAKTSLNTFDDILAEVNSLIEQKETEDYAKIFILRSNTTTTYQSHDYLRIMDVNTTMSLKSNVWHADFNL